MTCIKILYTDFSPLNAQAEIKAAYKSGEIPDQSAPITLEKIKSKLKQSEIFDWEDPTLTDRERKEMGKLFDAVEIMVRYFYFNVCVM